MDHYHDYLITTSVIARESMSTTCEPLVRIGGIILRKVEKLSMKDLRAKWRPYQDDSQGLDGQ